METVPMKERLWRTTRNPATTKMPLRMKTRSPGPPEGGELKCGPGTVATKERLRRVARNQAVMTLVIRVALGAWPSRRCRTEEWPWSKSS